MTCKLSKSHQTAPVIAVSWHRHATQSGAYFAQHKRNRLILLHPFAFSLSKCEVFRDARYFCLSLCVTPLIISLSVRSALGRAGVSTPAMAVKMVALAARAGCADEGGTSFTIDSLRTFITKYHDEGASPEAFPRRSVTAIKLTKHRRSGMDRRNPGSRDGAGLGASLQSGYRRSMPV